MPRAKRTRATRQVTQPLDHPDHPLVFPMLGLTIVPADSDDSDENWDENKWGGSSKLTEELALSRLPPLAQPTGPSIRFSGILGGVFMPSCDDDPRLAPMGDGFPVSVHPLRIPNARIQHSTASTHSVIDFTFVRLSGLLHKMVPLRRDVDQVKLTGIFGNPAKILGYVDVLFDAFGYEFEQRCWVLKDLHHEIQLGGDWAKKYKVSCDFQTLSGEFRLLKVDAKRVRKLQDVYTVY